MKGRLLQRQVRLYHQRWSLCTSLKLPSLGSILPAGAVGYLGVARWPSGYERQAMEVKSQGEVVRTPVPPHVVRKAIKSYTTSHSLKAASLLEHRYELRQIKKLGYCLLYGKSISTE